MWHNSQCSQRDKATKRVGGSGVGQNLKKMGGGG